MYMEDFFYKSILYDLYGGILSKKEQAVYEYHILEDLTFAEIGEEFKITRQAAYDLYKNADKRLKEIDDKLNLSKRFEDIETLAKEIKKLSHDNKKIINLSNKIINKVNKKEELLNGS